ncbi:MAG: hypothetical protein ACRD1B_11850 [Thermoanaerobaculia bacterium]
MRDEVKRGAEIIKIFLTPGDGAPSKSVEMELTRDELAAAIESAHPREMRGFSNALSASDRATPNQAAEDAAAPLREAR